MPRGMAIPLRRNKSLLCDSVGPCQKSCVPLMQREEFYQQEGHVPNVASTIKSHKL